jgi:hypothetical protein
LFRMANRMATICPRFHIPPTHKETEFLTAETRFLLLLTLIIDSMGYIDKDGVWFYPRLHHRRATNPATSTPKPINVTHS